MEYSQIFGPKLMVAPMAWSKLKKTKKKQKTCFDLSSRASAKQPVSKAFPAGSFPHEILRRNADF